MSTGTLVLTAANSYGSTTISNGLLQVGTGTPGSTLGTGPVTDNKALVFNGDNSFGSGITGTGTLTVLAGNVTLTGSNSYGNTTISSAGTLQIGNGTANGTLGNGPVVDNGALIFLDYTGSDTYPASNKISGTGTVTHAGADTLILSGVVSGTVSLTESGTGTLVLAANNTYKGNTTITAGTIQVGNISATGSLGTGAVAVAANGALVFDTPNSMTVANIITDNGSVTQEGTGPLMTLTGNISGTGSLTQGDTGTMILKGNNTSFTGTIAVNTGGTLQIGTAAATGMIGGSGAITDNGGPGLRSDRHHHRSQCD